jgi:Flp pilus assembly secretin CpaC
MASFALAGDPQGLPRHDPQFPVLGSIPIIGTLFRSTNFERKKRSWSSSSRGW